MSSRFDQEFERVFREEWEGLFRFVHRMTADADRSSDVAQEAFVRLYDRGSMPDDVRAWLASVANNLLRDAGRARERQRRLLTLRKEEAELTASRPGPDEALERAEDGRVVRRMLDSLPARQREVLLLRAGGMSYKEIGKALQMPASSVGQTLARALDAFRRLHPEPNDARLGR
jgi:RNA polymerase sigma-70 factor (ECF subfamily)